jgi:hypothetical protein
MPIDFDAAALDIVGNSASAEGLEELQKLKAIVGADPWVQEPIQGVEAEAVTVESIRRLRLAFNELMMPSTLTVEEHWAVRQACHELALALGAAFTQAKEDK